jgi:hypothetical protein
MLLLPYPYFKVDLLHRNTKRNKKTTVSIWVSKYSWLSISEGYTTEDSTNVDQKYLKKLQVYQKYSLFLYKQHSI